MPCVVASEWARVPIVGTSFVVSAVSTSASSRAGQASTSSILRVCGLGLSLDHGVQEESGPSSDVPSRLGAGEHPSPRVLERPSAGHEPTLTPTLSIEPRTTPPRVTDSSSATKPRG